MGSRQTRRSRNAVSEDVRDEQTNESVSSTTEEQLSPSPPEDEEDNLDLVSVLAFLLRSGQVRLVRSSLDGGGGIDVVHGLLSSDSESEGDDSYVYQNGGKNPEDSTPDRDALNESEFKTSTLLSSGQSLKSEKNVVRNLYIRERNLNLRQHFTCGDLAVVSANYLPNSMKVKARYEHKAFCGSYSQNGSVFLSACQDQRIRLYETTNGEFKEFRNIEARDVGWSVIDTAYSKAFCSKRKRHVEILFPGSHFNGCPDQNNIIYSSWSQYIHLCNIYGDYQTHSALDLRPDDSRFCAFSITFSQDSKEILCGANDANLYIYDRGADCRSLRILGHEDHVNAVSFADESSNILFSGADDGLCKVWDRRTLSENCPCPVGVLAGHSDGITFINSKGDGRYLISNSKDQSIKLWDMRRFSSAETQQATRRAVASQRWDYRWQPVPKRALKQQKIRGDSSLMTYRGHGVLHTLVRCYFSPLHTTGQRYIYTGCSTGSVVIYDVLTGEVVSKLRGHNSCVRDVSWHPYECNIVSTSWDGTLGLWSYFRSWDDEDKKAQESENPKPRRSARLLRHLLQ